VAAPTLGPAPSGSVLTTDQNKRVGPINFRTELMGLPREVVEQQAAERQQSRPEAVPQPEHQQLAGQQMLQAEVPAEDLPAK